MVAQAQVSQATQAANVELFAKIFLAGPYESATDSQQTTLFAAGLLPLTQPYSEAVFDGTPLAYDGFESVFSMPSTTVDWVLVELRTTPEASSQVARRAALLRTDGLVTGLDGSEAVRFNNVDAGAYYVVIRHRNHLAVMSAAPVLLATDAVTYDFTTGQAQAFGTNPMQEVEAGVFGLYPGDGNASGIVSASDQAVWLASNGFNGYLLGDFSLSGGATASDQALWQGSNGLASQVPEE